jgi:hypothetical protein
MSAVEVLSAPVRERWRTAGRFADVLEAEVRMRRSPLIARVVSWFNLCRLCQDIEEQMLLGDAAPEDRQLHRSMLSQTIAAGEGLLLECADATSLGPLGLTPHSIEAKLESLRISFDQWHTELKPARQEAILREVFGGET